MVVWFDKNASFLDNKVDYKKLIKNMEYIRKYTQKNEYCQYLYDLALEYQHFLKNEQHCSTIVENLVKNLSLCSTNTPVDIPNNSIILSPSHENTYHLVADFNKTKNDSPLFNFCR